MAASPAPDSVGPFPKKETRSRQNNRNQQQTQHLYFNSEKTEIDKVSSACPSYTLVRERARFSPKCCSDMCWRAWETKPTSRLLGYADMALSAGHCCTNLILALLEECSSHQQSKGLTTVPHILLNKLILASCKWEWEQKIPLLSPVDKGPDIGAMLKREECIIGQRFRGTWTGSLDSTVKRAWSQTYGSQGYSPNKEE